MTTCVGDGVRCYYNGDCGGLCDGEHATGPFFPTGGDTYGLSCAIPYEDMSDLSSTEFDG